MPIGTLVQTYNGVGIYAGADGLYRAYFNATEAPMMTAATSAECQTAIDNYNAAFAAYMAQQAKP